MNILFLSTFQLAAMNIRSDFCVDICFYFLVYILAWPKSSFGFSYMIKWKNPNEFFWPTQYLGVELLGLMVTLFLTG